MKICRVSFEMRDDCNALKWAFLLVYFIWKENVNMVKLHIHKRKQTSIKNKMEQLTKVY